MNSLFPSNPRLYLWGALGLLAILNWQQWMKDYPPPQVAALSAPASGAPAPQAPSGGDLASHIPQAAPAAGTAPAAAAAPVAAPETASAAAPAPAPDVHVTTDVLDVTISTRGGTLEQVDLLAYAQVKGQAARVRLENHDSDATLYQLQSGLTGPGNPAEYPSHLALYASPQSQYTLRGAELRVPLTWTGDGISVTKTFVFHPGQYAIGLEYQVHNGGAAPWVASAYAQILRNDPPTKKSMFNVDSYAFHGPALHDGTKYRKLDTDPSKDGHLSIEVTSGWVAALQHHFVSAIVPPPGAPWHFNLSAAGAQYLLSATSPPQTLAPGASATFTQTLFTGPKLQAQLKATSPELGRVADYGALWVLARPLFLLLSWVHGISGNWGVAIIFVTFLLKLAFYPLSEASGRSMAKMKALQPRIKNLQDTYKDDREKLGKAMMELYQREKINPVAGCLPILIQIPVFLAFYWALLESVEMRQAPFMLWIHDLSARDPWFILPAIMAVAMFVQYKLNPAPPDPVQAKVFMIMPFAMSVMFAFFPAGLVLYWVTNTILSIAQQWNINRRIAAAAASKRSN
ncbi:MAG: membrane protein insertase YidC [Proteobacteria bacterium]|nr:membrane protein insertase YidC [Pseudomonadota bacterium]